MKPSFFPSWCILLDSSGRILQTNLPLDSWLGAPLTDFFIGAENIRAENGSARFSWIPGKSPISFPENIILSANWLSHDGTIWLELEPEEETAADQIENSFWKEFLASDLPFRQIFETNQAIKWILDPDTGSILYVNQAACIFYGYSREELLGMNVTQINILTKEEVFEEMRRAAAESRLYFLFRHRLKGGEIRNVEVYSGPLQFGSKRVLFSIIYDVTERVVAMNRLELSEKRYRSLVESASDAIIIVDRETRIQEVNRRCEELLEYGRDELQSLTLQDVLDQESWRNTLEQIPKLEQGKPILFTRRFKSKTGRLIEAEVNAVRLEDSHYMGIVRDLTERNLLTRTLQKSLHEKDFMLQEIHHRVKNNLQVISSLLGLQYENSEDPNLKRILLECENRVKSMSFVHAELYKSDNLSEVDLESYFSALSSSLVRVYGAIQRVELQLELFTLGVTIEKAIPLGLILNELLTNSLKYAFPEGRKGKILVRISKKENDLEFYYSDDGVGFVPDDSQKAGSIGIQLVQILSEQLKSDPEFGSENGAFFRLRIPNSFRGK
ncbi:histidine kinase [Leptospira wolffii]|uniref:histidine kinase n=1 Tax=Leptospira wolffii TaxID=409998 RepID=A0A2M9Z8G1_9LEPT|nr:PAS domain S-box protein [Leptospira wolffii]PJZ64718.1 histidine kinase [Leptospira wolffii]